MPQGNYLPEGLLLHTEKNKSSIASISSIERSLTEGRILEARAILCDANHNLIVDLGEITGVIPRSEAVLGISEGATREIAVISRVGRPVCFKVMSICTKADGLPEITLSRKAAQEDALSYFMKSLTPGDVIRARVTHLEPFGAFVDIGCGIPSLIGIEHISVSRIAHPSDRLRVGDDIFAAVLQVDQNLRRICLTHRELLGTWEENAAMFSAGETVEGIIRGIEDYGVFIELTPNLSGLAEFREGLREGQRASVYIKSIIPERMKIKLIIIDTFPQEPGSIPSHPTYFIKSGTLKRWKYTPDYALKTPVETIF